MSQAVIIYGGAGQLGRSIVSHFKLKSWEVISIDLAYNADASHNVLVNMASNFQDQANQVVAGVRNLLGSTKKADAILCVAGGWAGGNAHHAVISANLAAQFLNEDGILQLTGAKAALGGCPGMVGYGLAKAAVHNLVKSLAETDSGLPSGSSVIAILPVTLDTDANRKSMPKADHSSWTPLTFVSSLLFSWAEQKSSRPPSGSLLVLTTKEGTTSVEAV